MNTNTNTQMMIVSIRSVVGGGRGSTWNCNDALRTCGTLMIMMMIIIIMMLMMIMYPYSHLLLDWALDGVDTNMNDNEES